MTPEPRFPSQGGTHRGHGTGIHDAKARSYAQRAWAKKRLLRSNQSTARNDDMTTVHWERFARGSERTGGRGRGRGEEARAGEGKAGQERKGEGREGEGWGGEQEEGRRGEGREGSE